MVAGNDNLLCTDDGGDTLFHIQLGCLIENQQVEQPVLLRQDLGNRFRRHQPDLDALEELEIELLDKLGYAGTSAALDGAVDFPLAFGGGDIPQVVCKHGGDMLTGQLHLLVDLLFHFRNDLFKRCNLREQGTVSHFKALDMLKEDGVIQLIVPLGHGSAADLVDFFQRRQVEIFVLGQRLHHRLEVGISVGEFIQALLDRLRLLHHQTQDIGAALDKVVSGRLRNVLGEAGLGCLPLEEGEIAPLVHLQDHLVNRILEQDQIVFGEIILHLEEPRVTLNGQLIVVQTAGELSV